MKILSISVLKIFVGFTVVMFVMFSLESSAQDINGELILHVPFEPDSYDESQWYFVVRNDNEVQNYGFLEEGPEGGAALVLYTFTLPDIVLNDIQYTNETLPLPEGADLYPWRITFWIHVNYAPFTIRPIVAMSEDPWTGTSFDYTIETAGEWHFVDVTLEAESALTTDPLLLIFHMGNPGDEFDENEIWFDEMNVYLLNEEPASVSDWMIMQP